MYMKTKNGYVDYTIGLPRPKTLVCVTDQRRCDRIIQAGKRLAALTDSELAVINIAMPKKPQDPESMEYLFSVSRENGAEMNVVFAEDISKAIIQYIKNNKISYMLTGIPKEGDSVTTKIWSKFTHVTFFVVEDDGDLQEVLKPAKAAQLLQNSVTV